MGEHSTHNTTMPAAPVDRYHALHATIAEQAATIARLEGERAKWYRAAHDAIDTMAAKLAEVEADNAAARDALVRAAVELRAGHTTAMGVTQLVDTQQAKLCAAEAREAGLREASSALVDAIAAHLDAQYIGPDEAETTYRLLGARVLDVRALVQEGK